MASRNTVLNQSKKDEKIQIYCIEEIPVENSTVVKKYRKFIYDQDLYEKGGIYANVREMTNTEIVNNGLEITRVNLKFIVNRRKEITSDCKVIYRGKVYDIGNVDNTDFRSNEISFTAVLTSADGSDPIKYNGGDLFEDL